MIVLIDLILRIVVVEKSVALEYIRNGSIKIKGFEAPGYEQDEDGNEKVAEMKVEENSTQETLVDLRNASKSTLGPWFEMITTGRSITLLVITLLNGIIVGAVFDTQLTIYLNARYGLDSLGAGLVFIASVFPAFFVSPFIPPLDSIFFQEDSMLTLNL